MYDELVKDLREISRNRAIPVHMAETVKEAANAIENMSEAYDKLSRHMDDLAALMPRWIPVTERLPEAGVYVLAYSADDGYMCVEARHKFSVFQITHWMPLPQPPKEE